MIKIERFIGGSLKSNGYIVYEHQGGKCFIIDPGYEGEKFLKRISELNLSLEGIILTHHHYDHIGGVAKIQSVNNCKVYIHRMDSERIKFKNLVLLESGTELTLETEKFKIIHTPGHTMGGICIYNERNKIAFTGDTLFLDDIGRTDLADGDGWLMRDSMVDIINKWDNDVVIYPGHGEGGTMKKVRKINEEFKFALTLPKKS